jgi:hypothetical protein
MSVHAPLPGELDPAHRDDRREQPAPDQEPKRNERERRQPRLDADLDEQVAAAPQEPEDEEQQVIQARGMVRHRPMVAEDWPHA